jgi:diguanylate cyclase (GGDEF)-like protein/PAS domain S-box-containing protein
VQALANLLRQEYRVKVANSGGKALEICAQPEQPALVLLDVVMPEMDGYEVCQRLKSDPATAGIPVIFVTAVSDQQSESRGLELGAADYITKPVIPAIARLRIRNQLDLHQAELKQKNLAQLLHSVLDAIPSAVFWKDRDSRYLGCNLKHARHVGLSHPDEIIGKSDEDFYPLTVAGKFRSEDQWVMGGEGRAIDYEAQAVSMSGKPLWTHTSKVLFRDAQGEMLGVLGAHEDITRRKQAEARQILAARVFDTAREAILVTDTQGNLLEVNDAFCRMSGYAREEVLGRNPRLLQSGVHSREFYQAMWQSLLEQGRWSGELWNRRKTGELYPELLTISTIKDDDGQVSYYVAVATDITVLKQHEKQLEYAAHYDILTGIPNRALLADRMRQALSQAKRLNKLLGICYLDLDGFKPINDSLGHEAGDYVLVEIARRIGATIRGGDTVARLGGDEFVILLVGLETMAECTATLERLLEVISQPIIYRNNQVAVSASVGVALYPMEDEDQDILLRHADQAMYTAKQTGKSRYHIYDASQDQRAQVRNEQYRRIESALAANEFELYYQPKVHMNGRRMFGAEALIRWRHPERGVLSPAEFLPVIENSPLEIVMGEWVIASALRQMDAWRGQGRALEISVNISAHHLLSRDFVPHLQTRLNSHPGLPAGSLQIEILETAALEDIPRVTQVIEACRSLGVGFALDDFGTGYSSLMYLSNLPVDTLKIDQTFVFDMLEFKGDHAIVQGVIALANAFGRRVVAEGVETEAQYSALREMGCESAQGYWIARPMPASELSVWHRDNEELWGGQ